MSKTKHVVWDWNGTLLDDVTACVAALNRVLERRLLSPITEETYRKTFSFPVKDFYIKMGIDFSKEDWDLMAREYHDFYEITSRDTPLREGVLEALKHLAGAGIHMSVLSAANTSILESMLKARNIRNFFTGIYGLSDLYASSKMDAGRRMMETIRVTPQEVLIIGDTIHDYEVAEELGCRCVLVQGGHQADDRLAGCACDILPGTGEISQRIMLFL